MIVLNNEINFVFSDLKKTLKNTSDDNFAV